ncbi:MAG TPA: phosphatidylserine/phosphatidylglycerophosphate/cardiolipin synthase family protein [Verrucomicrobiae bacterium]|nr:phosphatidylserine/phosphatidylglycerophosphate/cardiolipin synthase family protein [Verrucomicrobiae bacterium]
MLAAIAAARTSIDLEFYIFADDVIGREFLSALVHSAQRGVKVRALVDSYGSFTLPGKFFQSLITAGGEVRFFNPLRFNRFGVRDHRKLLICDHHTVFTGGANIANEYDGNGVTKGWLDLMLKIESAPLANALAHEFAQIYNSADFKQGRLRKLRIFRQIRRHSTSAEILSIRPGRGASSYQRALYGDLQHASSADMITPYFLPSHKLRRQLQKIVRRGGKVRLILPKLSDVPVSRAAGMVYYPRLLKAGIEIYEYQPQILHMKLYRVDDKVFAGSSNFDFRSFNLNYELMLRFTDKPAIDSAKEIFTNTLKNCRQIKLEEFLKTQNFWSRLRNRWAHFLVARIDPFVALRHIGRR